MKSTVAFGTDGIRGNAEKYPFTKEGLFFLGKAIAKWASEKYKKSSPTVLIGMDTRISGERIKQDLCAGLQNLSANVVDAGVIPTPAICRLANINKKFDFGIVISASHNPYQDNGVKIFNAQTCKLTPEDEKQIIQNFEYFANSEDSKITTTPNLPEAWSEASDEYLDSIKTFFKPNFLNNMKIILDCANGATYKVAPAIFKYFGADVVALFNEPTGTNINKACGALHTDALAQEVVKQKAAAGFAFDGDGDRLTCVNRHGEIRDGDDALFILSQLPYYKNMPKVVGTVMSNQGLQTALTNIGKEFVRANVGDKHVAAILENDNLLLGGEPSGHTILKDYLTTGDGIFTALRIAESMILNQNLEMKSFTKYPQILVNIPVTCKKDLTHEPFAKIISEHEIQLCGGRALVRFSGTENLLRIMTEAENLQTAERVAQSLASALRKLL